jgi:predicted cobalt transporter CbtA
MSAGDVVGLLAVLVFAALVGMLAVPLIKLGRTFDRLSASIDALTEHSVPILDEAVTTVATTNTQLGKVDVITTSAAQVSENVSALAGLYAATLGGPLVKVASFSYGVRRAVAQGMGRVKGGGR